MTSKKNSSNKRGPFFVKHLVVYKVNISFVILILCFIFFNFSFQFNKIFGLHERQGTQAKSEPLTAHSVATTKSVTPDTNYFDPVNRTSSSSNTSKPSSQMMMGNVGTMATNGMKVSLSVNSV